MRFILLCYAARRSAHSFVRECESGDYANQIPSIITWQYQVQAYNIFFVVL